MESALSKQTQSVSISTQCNLGLEFLGDLQTGPGTNFILSFCIVYKGLVKQSRQHCPTFSRDEYGGKKEPGKIALWILHYDTHPNRQ